MHRNIQFFFSFIDLNGGNVFRCVFVVDKQQQQQLKRLEFSVSLS